jgi:Na+-driven multidrug efflux pump
VVTGNSAASNIEGFIYVAMNSIAIAVTTIVGQNVGAGKIERIKKILPISLVMVTVTGVVLGGAANFFGEQLLSIYEPGDSEVAGMIRAAGRVRMLYIGLPYFMCGCMDCISYSLKGMGRAAISMMVSIFGSCVLRIIWIFAVCPLFPQNISVLYMAYPITWTVTACG